MSRDRVQHVLGSCLFLVQRNSVAQLDVLAHQLLGYVQPRADVVDQVTRTGQLAVVEVELARRLRHFDHLQPSLQILDVDRQLSLGSQHALQLLTGGLETVFPSSQDLLQLIHGRLGCLEVLETIGQVRLDLERPNSCVRHRRSGCSPIPDHP